VRKNMRAPIVEGSGFSLLNEDEIYNDEYREALPMIQEANLEQRQADRADAWNAYHSLPLWKRVFTPKPG
jgi:hypothetical protein